MARTEVCVASGVIVGICVEMGAGDDKMAVSVDWEGGVIGARPQAHASPTTAKHHAAIFNLAPDLASTRRLQFLQFLLKGFPAFPPCRHKAVNGPVDLPIVVVQQRQPQHSEGRFRVI